jgi:fermentation-respiration switch protein FrsA (DUF1100 family)
MMLKWLQQRLLYPHYRLDVAEKRPDLPESGEWLAVDGVSVDVAHFKSNISRETPRPAVIFAHGNSESIDEWLDDLCGYLETGIDVLVPEYRGYGRSSGSPTKAGIIEDFLTVTEYFSELERIDEQSLLFHGRSLGGGIACELAWRYQPKGLILESTFTSLQTLVNEKFGLPRWLVREYYNNAAFLEEYPGPTLIFHGKNDDLIPVSHGRRLQEASPEAQLITLEGAGHNDIPYPWPELKAFVRRLVH